MIYEYALEPEVLASWAANSSDYRFAFDKFGLGQPRLVSEYPSQKNWIKRIYDAATGLKDERLEIEKLTALIGLIREKMIRRQNSSYHGDDPWLENALREHKRFPFHGIVATANPNRYIEVLLSSELGLRQDDRWDKQRELFVSRTAEAMSQAVAPMLNICQEVIFIDRYFNPVPERGYLDRYLESFAAFFSVMSKNSKLRRIEVYADSSSSDFQKTCNNRMPSIIPRNLKIRFIQLQERSNGPRLHDRYILTDIGGLEFSVGLDVGNGDVRISLLSKRSYMKLLDDYCGDNPAFDYEADFQINGTAPLAA
jgi:hypothetical protein